MFNERNKGESREKSTVAEVKMTSHKGDKSREQVCKSMSGKIILFLEGFNSCQERFPINEDRFSINDIEFNRFISKASKAAERSVRKDTIWLKIKLAANKISERRKAILIHNKRKTPLQTVSIKRLEKVSIV